MDDNDIEDLALRKTLNVNSNEEIKWKKISIIFIILSMILLTVLIVILIFSSSNDKKKEEIPKKWDWKPMGNRIKTKWSKELNIENIWQEHPRPQLERNEWVNLNGEWNYSIRNLDSIKPNIHDGKILVPFPIESSLSGVMRNVTENDIIWYEKEIDIPEKWKNKKILINFGAVDWKCTVYINEWKVGEHTGGYTFFSFDISEYIHIGKNRLSLKVWDPTDKSYIPLGKQTLTPNSIWYTPSSGIWQSVWIEAVNDHYIENLIVKNNFDDKNICIIVKANTNIKLNVTMSISYKGLKIGSVSGLTGDTLTYHVEEKDFHPWSPDSPSLYDLNIHLFSKYDISYDNITSYTAIRKLEKRNHTDGQLRLYLNNKPLFLIGTLDQGFWPDGLHTPPSEKAMIYDINELKNLGFNTIRKHIKIENFRYYYACDKIGMLIWQDMPAGDIAGSHWDPSGIDKGSDKERSEESKKNYYKEWGEIIDNLQFFQSIVIWVPFNEGWGQFLTEDAVKFTQSKDNTRLINAASGGNHRITGDFLDIHHYPQPEQAFSLDTMVNVLGEYGGVGLEIKNHTWKEKNFAYIQVNTTEELTSHYIDYIDSLANMIKKKGFSAAIYTQTTDVEGEINGLITYDREIIKVIEKGVKEANMKIIKIFENEYEE